MKNEETLNDPIFRAVAWFENNGQYIKVCVCFYLFILFGWSGKWLKTCPVFTAIQDSVRKMSPFFLNEDQ